jgi:hypothetical protein
MLLTDLLINRLVKYIKESGCIITINLLWIEPPVQWVVGLSRGKVRQGRAADHSSPSSAEIKEE